MYQAVDSNRPCANKYFKIGKRDFLDYHHLYNVYNICLYPLKFKGRELTGDSDIIDYQELLSVDVMFARELAFLTCAE